MTDAIVDAHAAIFEITLRPIDDRLAGWCDRLTQLRKQIEAMPAQSIDDRIEISRMLIRIDEQLAKAARP